VSRIPQFSRPVPYCLEARPRPRSYMHNYSVAVVETVYILEEFDFDMKTMIEVTTCVDIT
jgi:hypothetical protein